MINRRSKKANLRMESLEDRNLMAGDVVASVTNGTLFLMGDQDSNGVELTSTEVDGQYIVSGIDAGGEATTINGQSTPLVIDGVERHIRVRMGEGDDVLRAPNLDVDGSMHVRMGVGNDAVHIGDIDSEETVVEIARGLRISLGDGDDRAGVANAELRRIAISGGNGADEIRVRDSTLARSLRVAGRGGSDDIRVNNVEARHIGIHAGADDDTVEINDSQARLLTAHLGRGDDTLTTSDSEARRVRFSGSAGTDTLVTDLVLEEIGVRGFENL